MTETTELLPNINLYQEQELLKRELTEFSFQTGPKFV